VLLPFKVSLVLGIICVLGLVISPNLAKNGFAKPQFTVIDLGTLPKFTNSVATAINDKGQVVGWTDSIQVAAGTAATNARRGFLWENGKMTDLGELIPDAIKFEGLNSYQVKAVAINNQGQIVGSAEVMPFRTHAFLWEKGKLTDLGSLDGKTYTHSYATGINDKGQIIGGGDLKDRNEHAALWVNGKVTVLDTPAGTVSSVTAGINTAGQIVGCLSTTLLERHAVLWDAGKPSQLPLPAEMPDSSAMGINDAEQVVGGATTLLGKTPTAVAPGQAPARKLYGPRHAFIWAAGKLTDLGTLGGAPCVANSISATGQVVGASYGGTGAVAAFLWKDSQMYDLNATLPKDSGWVLKSANGINAKGQIVGEGVYKGQHHAFLLTPMRTGPSR